MYYFAYGMNTNLRQMANRCPAAKSLGPSIIFDHVFEFRYHADVREEEGQTAVGVLWKITPECLDALDMLEGFPSYYDRKTVKVAHEELGIVEALVYYMNEQDGLSAPGEYYYDMVHEGYAEHGVNTEVLRSANDDAVMYEINASLM